MEMDKICWQCGDIGVQDALVYCAKCKISQRHSYCLDVLPEDLTAEIIWLCQECLIKSPDSSRKARFPKASPLILSRSERPTIGTNHPSQVQHPILNIRNDSSTNTDNHFSEVTKIESGAPSTASSVSSFRNGKDELDKSLPTIDTRRADSLFASLILPINSVEASIKDEKEDIGKWKLKGRRAKRRKLILPFKDKLNSFHPPIDGEDNNILLPVKRIPNTVTSSSCSSLNGVKMVECKNEKPETKCLVKSIPPVEVQCADTQFAAKRLPSASVASSDMLIKWTSGLDIGGLGAGNLSKEELNMSNPLVGGEDPNISLAVKKLPSTVSSSSCSNPNEVEMIEYGNEKPERKSLDKSKPLIEHRSEDTRFIAEKLSSTSLAASDMDLIKSNSGLNIGELGARNSLKKELDTCDPLADAKRTNNSIGVKRMHGVEPFGKQVTGLTPSHTVNTMGAMRSSTCFKEKENKIENNGRVGNLVLPIKDEFNKFQPLINGQDANILYPNKKLPATSVKLSDRLAMGRTGSIKTDASSEARSFSCSTRLNPPINKHPVVEGKRGGAPFSGKMVACFSEPVKGAQVEERGKEMPMIRKFITKDGNAAADEIHHPAENNGASFKPVDKMFSGCTEVSQNQGISYCSRLKEENTDHCFENTDRKMIVTPLTCYEFGAKRSSGCSELEAEKDKFGKERQENRILNLNSNDGLICLDSVTNSRSGVVKFADKKSPGTSVEASDKQMIAITDMKDQMKLPCQKESQSAPFISHVWSGSFNINEGEIGPLRAILSSRACEKVCLLARKLPIVLRMQKLPRLVAWPNSFKVSSPTDDHIALYFSPDSDRAEIALDDLVDDIINNDLMLKCHFDEIELLIFSSFVLPQEHQRLDGKYYVWGVFKPRSVQVDSVPSGSHAVPNGVAKENQVDSLLKPEGRNQVKAHINMISKDPPQETNACTLRIQPGKEMELKEVAKERIELNLSNAWKSMEEKSNSAELSISRRRNKTSGMSGDGNSSDYDDSSVTDLTTEHLGGHSSCFEISKELPKAQLDTEEGEVCDGRCFNDSKNEPTYLGLLALRIG